jgi:hypothetical protein
MLGTLNDGVYNFKHLASVIRLQIPTLPKTTTKVVFETLNTPITGTYTATVTDETPTLEALDASGNSVTVNFSEALTEDITDARILIPVPAGTLKGGFRISVYDTYTDSKGNTEEFLYSSYTTYKDKTAARNKLMLYTLYPNTEAATTDDGGVIAFDANNATAGSVSDATRASSTTYTLTSGDWVITNSSKEISQYDNTYWKFKYNTDLNLTIPANKEVTKITFYGSSQNTSTAAYLSKFGDKTFTSTDYIFRFKNTGYATQTFIPAEPIKGGDSGSTFTFQFGGKDTYMLIYVTYKNSATE